MLARLNRGLENGETLQIQTYFDHTRRDYPGTFSENLHTYDIDLQRSLLRGGNHKLVLGGGYRHSRSEIINSNALAFLPPNKTLSLANVFLQDELDLNDRFKLTIGARLERNNYTGWEKQPNVRLAWKPNEKSVLWSSIAQAVRTPSRIDREFYVPGSSPYSTYGGGAGFVSEKLTAYEIGYRNTPNLQTTFSISTFYNDYDKLRSLEPNGSTTVFANMMEGHTHGVETWASYQVADSSSKCNSQWWLGVAHLHPE